MKKTFKIYSDKDKILRTRCTNIDNITEEDKELVKAMVTYLKNSQDEDFQNKYHVRSGVGLAANQIGYDKRFFAIYYPNENDKIIQYGLINPQIISSSVRKCALKGGEGCLSVKEDKKGYVYRYYKIVMKGFDVLQNKDIEITARGYDAIVLQHEYDHLDGIIYYDRINKNNPFGEIENSVLI